MTVDTSGATEAEALTNMATTIATSLGIPMGTATTVTTTEDGITVAYLTTTDEHGEYITAVDSNSVALVPNDQVESIPQQVNQVTEEESKALDDVMMDN